MKKHTVASAREELLTHQKRKPYYTPRMHWSEDMGRRLENYRRIHTFLLNHFGTKLKGKRVLHLGAGNGQYMDLLQRHFGAKTTAIEVNQKHIHSSRKKGLNPGYVKESALDMKSIATGSQDVVLSDRFILSAYGLPSGRLVKEAQRVLKKGGLLILERSLTVPVQSQPKFFEGFEVISTPEIIAESRKMNTHTDEDMAGHLTVLKKK